jgi:hypothetical protein
MPAIRYGREFLYFALFLPLALLGLRRRRDLVGFAVTLGAGAALFSMGQIIDQITHTPLTWLIHIEKTREFEGITRIYAPMNDLIIAAFPMAFAAMLIAPRPWRRRAIPLTVLTGVANVLTFVRAVYLSELLALFLISLIWARGAGWRPRHIRYAFAMGIAGILALALAVAAVGETTSTNTGIPSPIRAVVARAELGFSDVQGQSGSVGERLQQTDRELEVLGNHWVAGLGFLNPAYHYVVGLREGSIRDSDLGSLNIVMTLGIIGLFLAYMPLIGGLIYLLKRRYSFVQYGGAMYLTGALVGSVTLGAIAHLSGLLVLGSMLPLCLNWTALAAPTA